MAKAEKRKYCDKCRRGIGFWEAQDEPPCCCGDRDTSLQEAILKVVEAPPHFAVEIFGLSIYLCEDNKTYSVNWEPSSVWVEGRKMNKAAKAISKDFRSREKAIEYFFATRKKLQLGVDIEIELLQKEKK